jgi:hypothetical protein
MAVLALTGCGGSSDAPPAAAPAPAAPGAPAATGTATPVAAPDTSSTGVIGNDVREERVAARKAIREWGRAATKACRKLDRLQAPWAARFRSMTGGRPTRARIKELGRAFEAYGKIAEREYDLVRAIPLPTQPEALDAVDDFLQKEEEALMLLHRGAVHLQGLDDALGIVNTARRFNDLLDDYKRAARAVHAAKCYD